MTWFRVDDGFAFHHKAVGVGNAALGLWLRAGSWCSQQLTDGVVPAHMVKALGGSLQQAKALVAFGLWEDQGDGTFLFHDWHLYQPTSAEVKAERLAISEKKAEAGRLGGIASGVSRRANKQAETKQTGSSAEAEGEANGKQNEAPSLPLPSLPSQPPVVSATKHTIPEDWTPSVEDRSWAAVECPQVNIDRETASFVDFFLDKAEKRPGWTRSWKRWMREAQERAEKRTPLRAVPDDRLGSWDV
jgi:hypothetical protein